MLRSGHGWFVAQLEIHLEKIDHWASRLGHCVDCHSIGLIIVVGFLALASLVPPMSCSEMNMKARMLTN